MRVFIGRSGNSPKPRGLLLLKMPFLSWFIAPARKLLRNGQRLYKIEL
jgi:hypothetical protein